MRAFLNELALSEACRASSQKQQPLIDLLSLRAKHPEIRNSLYCSKELRAYQIDGTLDIDTLIRLLPRDNKLSFLHWMTSKGPFFDDDRLADPETDLYNHSNSDVTRLGLGEAAARTVNQGNSCVFSPTTQKTINNQATPLKVQKISNSEPETFINVLNYWITEKLIEYIVLSKPEAKSWTDLIHQVDENFPNLLIGNECFNSLKRTPYNSVISRAILNRLHILNEIAKDRDTSGKLLTRANELYELHFTGKDPLFSDESDGNKTKFRNAMTFPDPTGGGKVIYFWHGKIKQQQQRIHFEWPIPKGAKRIKVAYIGPKISRR